MTRTIFHAQHIQHTTCIRDKNLRLHTVQCLIIENVVDNDSSSEEKARNKEKNVVKDYTPVWIHGKHSCYSRKACISKQ